MQSPSEKFLNFLENQGISAKINFLEDDITNLVSINYDSLSESTLRALVQTALAERDSNISKGFSDETLLGDWGVVIDTVKVFCHFVCLSYY